MPHPHVFWTLPGWWLDQFLGKPIPTPEHYFSEENFPNTQSKLPLVELETISSCPITCYLGEDTDPPYYNLLSWRCGERKGLLWASLSPGWTPSIKLVSRLWTQSAFWCFAEDTFELSKRWRCILLFLHLFRRYLLYNRYIKGPYVSIPTALHAHQPLHPPKEELTHSSLALSIEVCYSSATKLPPKLKYGASALPCLLKLNQGRLSVRLHTAYIKKLAHVFCGQVLCVHF